MLGDAAFNKDFDFIKNWCAYNGEGYKEVTVSNQYFVEKGAVASISYFSYGDEFDWFDGIVVEISDGTHEDQLVDEGDEYDSEDSDEFELSYELNVYDRGQVIEGFDGYDMELTNLIYDPEAQRYLIIISVRNKDGSEFVNDRYVMSEDMMDFVYGDVTPLMDATHAVEFQSGYSWINYEDTNEMRVQCACVSDVDLRDITEHLRSTR